MALVPATSEHRTSLVWKRTSSDFTYATYNRDHVMRTGSGVTLPASSAPEYRGDPDRVNPEEALVAALSSCHMLTFLMLAAKRRFVVDAYEDDAVGYLTKNTKGKMHLGKCVLRPRIVWRDAPPSADVLAELHATAHEECFIAQSVVTDVVVELG
jgi:organic hydroperoxide reductase OsmC/OhrA